jgi:hypothetical protein
MVRVAKIEGLQRNREGFMKKWFGKKGSDLVAGPFFRIYHPEDR